MGAPIYMNRYGWIAGAPILSLNGVQKRLGKAFSCKRRFSVINDKYDELNKKAEIKRVVGQLKLILLVICHRYNSILKKGFTTYESCAFTDFYW